MIDGEYGRGAAADDEVNWRTLQGTKPGIEPVTTFRSSGVRYKIATEPWEFAEIHRLNYATFVEEITQHPSNPHRTLIDKFEAENTYIVGLRGTRLVAMIAVRGDRPFSLDLKLADLDSWLPSGRTVCEVRLLSVAPDQRRGRVFAGLLPHLARHCADQRYDLAIISGTLRQRKLYQHLGFEPFGPLVGTSDALFQPMYLKLERAQALLQPFMGDGQTSRPASAIRGSYSLEDRDQRS